jgi:hypothetical protein
MELSIPKLSRSGLNNIIQRQRKHSCPMQTTLPRKTNLSRRMSVFILFGKRNTKRKLLPTELIKGNNMRDCIFYYSLLDLPFQQVPSFHVIIPFEVRVGPCDGPSEQCSAVISEVETLLSPLIQDLVRTTFGSK